MGWRAENAVTVVGAILIGTAGSFWLGLTPSNLGPGVFGLRGQPAEASPVPANPVSTSMAAEPSFADMLPRASFFANSLESTFSVRGRYAGEPLYTADGIGVELSSVSAVTDIAEGSRNLTGIRLVLAEATADGGWKVVERGPLHYVGLDMSGATRWSKRGSLLLQLPGVDYQDLEGRWLVIEHELWDQPDPSGPGRKAYTYAHSDGSALKLLLSEPHGC